MSTTALTAVLAKLAGLGTAAKATVGLAVAAGAVSAAAGVPMVVHEIATVGGDQVVVSTTDEPTRDVTAEPTVEPTADPSTEPTDDPSTEPTDDPAVAMPGWQDAETFGAWVSAQARAGEVDGQQIAAAAHERNQLRAASRVGTEDATDDSGDQEQIGDQDKDQARDRDQTCVEDCTPIGDGTRAGGSSQGNGH